MGDPRVIIAEVTAQHHLDLDRTDADGHSFCVCGGWADGEMSEGWDDHMADVAVDALRSAGLLVEPGGQTRTEWAIGWQPPGESWRMFGREYDTRSAAEAEIALRSTLGFTHNRLLNRTMTETPWQPVEEKP